jgi:addiction module HigA family antidote
MREEVGISADTALRLGRFFGTTPDFWLVLQADFDMETARTEIAGEVEAIKPLDRAAA